ncbi:MAG: hypothetical protein KAU21_00655 [Gammaproteobacteria bacterium]|nr:hypothetical protein [Gammaproteobacteria bacterium]
MTSLASLDEAHQYFKKLPEELAEYFDEAYQAAFDQLMQALEQFFDVTETVNQQAADDHIISSTEATEIGDHGFILLLKLVDLMEKLDLPHRRKEIEQISLIFARWVIRYRGQLKHIEPIVNAFAHSANSMKDKKSLLALLELMGLVVDASSDEIKHDLESSNIYRPWRLLHINRSIVATRTHDADIMKKVFDEMILYLPQDSASFFSEGMQEMDALDYPPNVRKVIEEYFLHQPKIKLH